MKKKKYVIVVDSSVINLSDSKFGNFKYFQTCKDLYDFVSFIASQKLTHIKIALPRVVINELKKHQLDAYISQKEELSAQFDKFKYLPDFSLEQPQELNYETHLDEKIRAYIAKYNIKVIETPTTDIMDKLLQKALNKEKPFYKKGTDSGFKDAVIWESILEYAQRNKEESIIFWVKDPDFLDEKLANEFLEKTGENILVYSTQKEIKELLDKEYELHLQLSQFFAKVDDNLFEQIYRLMKKNYKYIKISISESSVSPIIDFFMTKEIIDINYDKKEALYSIRIPVNISHQPPYSITNFMDYTWAPYEEAMQRNIISAKIRLTNVGLTIDNIKFENSGPL